MIASGGGRAVHHIESPAMTGLLLGNQADSDVRLQVLLHEQQGVRAVGMATVSGTVSKLVSGITTCHN
jgi:hypothetical protein